MPKGGSLNQTVSSDFTTTSLGEFRRLPSKLSAITVIEPSYSVRITRRPPCSQLISRPWRSRVLPLAKPEGWRKVLTWPLDASHFRMRLFGISLHSR